MATRPAYLLWLIAALLLIVAFTAVGGLSFLAGGIVGQEQLYATWRQRKLDKLTVVLREPSFANVRAEHSSADQVYLAGTLPTADARQMLLQQLTDSFGKEEAEHMLSLVEVQVDTRYNSAERPATCFDEIE